MIDSNDGPGKLVICDFQACFGVGMQRPHGVYLDSIKPQDSVGIEAASDVEAGLLTWELRRGRVEAELCLIYRSVWWLLGRLAYFVQHIQQAASKELASRPRCWNFSLHYSIGIMDEQPFAPIFNGLAFSSENKLRLYHNNIIRELRGRANHTVLSVDEIRQRGRQYVIMKRPLVPLLHRCSC